jgi:hypothetical protein
MFTFWQVQGKLDTIIFYRKFLKEADPSKALFKSETVQSGAQAGTETQGRKSADEILSAIQDVWENGIAYFQACETMNKYCSDFIETTTEKEQYQQPNSGDAAVGNNATDLLQPSLHKLSVVITLSPRYHQSGDGINDDVDSRTALLGYMIFGERITVKDRHGKPHWYDAPSIRASDIRGFVAKAEAEEKSSNASTSKKRKGEESNDQKEDSSQAEKNIRTFKVDGDGLPKWLREMYPSGVRAGSRLVLDKEAPGSAQNGSAIVLDTIGAVCDWCSALKMKECTALLSDVAKLPDGSGTSDAVQSVHADVDSQTLIDHAGHDVESDAPLQLNQFAQVVFPLGNRVRGLGWYKYSHLLMWHLGVLLARREKARKKRKDEPQAPVALDMVLQALKVRLGDDALFHREIAPHLAVPQRAWASRANPVFFAAQLLHSGVELAEDIRFARDQRNHPFGVSLHLYMCTDRTLTKKGNRPLTLAKGTTHIDEFPQLANLYAANMRFGEFGDFGDSVKGESSVTDTPTWFKVNYRRCKVL